MRDRKFFQNRSTAITFIILLIGFLLILVASLFVYSVYQRTQAHRFTLAHLRRELVHMVRLAKIIPAQQLPHYVRDLQFRSLRVSLVAKAQKNSQAVYLTNRKIFNEIAKKLNAGESVSIFMNKNQWLWIRLRLRPKHPWQDAGIITCAFLLLIALVLLCLWAAQGLSLPIAEFADAVKRFGVDINAPPVAVMGPPEVQEVIKTFNEMQNRIRRLLHDRTQMLAAISHDLRTPITRLKLRAEYLQNTPQYEKAVADLNEMEKMIASILAFARDYTRVEKMEKIDINSLLETLCNDFTDAGHEVEYHGEKNRVVFFGKLTPLKRAFSNFIDNAIKYGKSAKVSLRETSKVITIKVTDQGPGIPEEEMENVFNPFYRIDTARSPENGGVGLGMTVARDIILAHGGEISLINRRPHGLTVQVQLPRALA